MSIAACMAAGRNWGMRPFDPKTDNKPRLPKLKRPDPSETLEVIVYTRDPNTGSMSSMGERRVITCGELRRVRRSAFLDFRGTWWVEL